MISCPPLPRIFHLTCPKSPGSLRPLQKIHNSSFCPGTVKRSSLYPGRRLSYWVISLFHGHTRDFFQATIRSVCINVFFHVWPDGGVWVVITKCRVCWDALLGLCQVTPYLPLSIVYQLRIALFTPFTLSIGIFTLLLDFFFETYSGINNACLCIYTSSAVIGSAVIVQFHNIWLGVPSGQEIGTPWVSHIYHIFPLLINFPFNNKSEVTGTGLSHKLLWQLN